MGQAIAEYYNKEKSKKLYVYSDITDDDEIPISYLFRDFNDMPKIEQYALNNCKGSILDVGAAAGSHSLWLQNNGFSVSAIDISELSVQAMQIRGVKDARVVDIYEFQQEQKYDTLLLLMNGAGIAGELKNLPNLLNKCSSLIKENGQILIDSSDINYMFDDDDEKPADKYYGEVEYTMSYGSCTSDMFSWLFIDSNTLKLIAHKCGLKCETVCKGENYDYLARLTFNK